MIEDDTDKYLLMKYMAQYAGLESALAIEAGPRLAAADNFDVEIIEKGHMELCLKLIDPIDAPRSSKSSHMFLKF